MRWFVGLLVVLAVVMAFTWGLRAAFVFGFLAGLAALLSYAAAVGGGWLERTSRGRFKGERGRER